MGVCFIWIVLSSSCGASEHVPGAGPIEASGSLEEVLMDMAKFPPETNKLVWFRDGSTLGRR